ncbi:helix-turn-helix transcriptional regulator [Euryhalocaulis caribicus]|uniref:helix-turn-helix transcriptional regulator n=1 Tax=Euryhalocaulis caribicus TaxID=1161401 RepID=UPI00039B1104|nr:helix-turn-helix transcriptional regulator [Euryhalocaulis caribicus]
MKAEDFRAWLEFEELMDATAARILGIGSRNTLAKYKKEGAPTYIGLACAAYSAGMDEWKFNGQERATIPHSAVKAMLEGENPIKALRNAHGMSRDDLAEACGASSASIKELEDEIDRQTRSEPLLRRVANQFDVDVDIIRPRLGRNAG